MSEPAATPEQANGAAQPEAPAAEPVVEYRRPQGRNVPEHIRAALDGAEADTKATQDAKAGKPEANEPEKAAEKPTEPEAKPHKTASQLHAEALRRVEGARALEERTKAQAEERIRTAEEKAKAAEAKFAELDALDEMGVLQRVAERKGIPLDQLVKRAIARIANKGQLPPDEQTRADIEVARKEAQEAKAETEKLRKERDEEAAKAQEVAAQRTIEDWKQNAASLGMQDSILDDEGIARPLQLLPTLGPGEIADRAYDVMSAYYAATKEREGTGVVPSYASVLLFLEQQEQAAFEQQEALQEARRRKLQTPSQETESTAPGSAIPAQQSRTARTLTNRDASERASSRKKPTSERDLIAYAAEAIPD